MATRQSMRTRWTNDGAGGRDRAGRRDRRLRAGARRRRHGAGHGQGSDRRRDGRCRRRSRQSGHRLQAHGDDGRRRAGSSSAIWRREVPPRSRPRRASRRSRTTWRSAPASRSSSISRSQLEGHVTSVEVVGHQDLIERDPTAHTDIDQSLVAKLPLDSVVGPEPGHHARLAGRRRRLERLLPSRRRPRADAVLDRQPAGHRSAEPGVFEPDLARTPSSRWR